jgi:hypothetical protein
MIMFTVHASYFFITVHSPLAVESSAHGPPAVESSAHGPPAVEPSVHGPPAVASSAYLGISNVVEAEVVTIRR